MKKTATVRLLTVLCLLFLIAACGGEGDSGESSRQALTPAEKAAALDQGPRAVETMTLDEDLAARGAVLFDEKICSDCHTMGEADIGPDLLGVTDRRTEKWLVMQITQPEWMSEHDPITQKLVAEFEMEMVDLQVPEADVEPLLQYLLRESRGQ